LIDLFREYATRCLSDANSKASREWRVNFLFNILSGTYVSNVSVESNEQLSNIAIDWIEVIQSKDINLTLHSLLALEFASDKHLVAYSLNRSIFEWGSVYLSINNKSVLKFSKFLFPI
jgi:hypothetical protein